MMLFFTYELLRIIRYFPILILFFHFQAAGKMTACGKEIDKNLLLSDTTPSVNSSGYYVSNKGTNWNNGTSESTPRLNIDSIETLVNGSVFPGGREVSLNLEANSLFREQFDPNVGGLNINSYGLTGDKLPAKITGMDVISSWTPAQGRSDVYQHLLFHSIDLYSSGYSYIMVAEIDTVLEKTRPVSAVKYLQLVNSLDICQTYAGTYYVEGTITNPAMVSIHPSQGVPGLNKYRYEVTTRNYSINGYYVNNATYKDLFLQTSGYGYGMLAAGDNSKIRNVIFQGGGTHHTVIKSGEIDSSLFLPGPLGLKDRIAAVFYEDEGAGNHNRITNSIFLDIPNAILAHTNGVIKHNSLTIDKVFAFGDSSDASSAFGANDTDSVRLLNSYTENYPTGWLGTASHLNIQNTIFRNTSQSAIYIAEVRNVEQNTVIKNVLIKTNGNDKNQSANNDNSAFGIRAPYVTTNVDVSHMIIHGYSMWNTSGPSIRTFQVGGHLTAHKNIYICDVNNSSVLHISRASNQGGIGKSTNITSDSNVYVLVRGAGFHWYVDPNNDQENNIFTLEQFQRLTGQDKHSIFIDLKNNPLGLKAIFVDPENGNWTLTESPQASAIKKLGAGMTNPPLYYPQRPLYENTIAYKAPEGFSGLSGTINENDEFKLHWKSYNEWSVSSFEIEYSNDSINFSSVGNVPANGNSKENLYDFTHKLPDLPLHFYRLKIVNKDNSARYSNVMSLKLVISNNEDILFYPNPVEAAINVKYPRRDKSALSIYDFSGKLIHNQPLPSQSRQTVLYLNHLPVGMYLIKWNSGKEQSVRSFFKAK